MVAIQPLQTGIALIDNAANLGNTAEVREELARTVTPNMTPKQFQAVAYLDRVLEMNQHIADIDDKIYQTEIAASNAAWEKQKQHPASIIQGLMG